MELKRLSVFGSLLCAVILMLCSVTVSGQGTWTALRDTAPNINVGVMLLLTDGTVICKAANDYGELGNIWNKLTPDSRGSYINGTWSTIAPMADERYYFSSQMLKSGKIYVAGGEYGSGVNKAELYDPVADSWTPIPGVAPEDSIADANSKLLPDGRVMQNIVNSAQTFYGTKNIIYDPVTNTYSPGPSCVGDADESAWVLLPDNSILFIDIHSYLTDRYIPSLGRWKRDAPAPAMLYDNYIFEDGPAVQLPDGSVLFLGANSNTAIYYPSGDTTIGQWSLGPLIPAGNGIPDGSAAMLPDGRVLCAVSPVPNGSDPDSLFHSPTFFYEYDYTTNGFTQVSAPYSAPIMNPVNNPPFINVATFVANMVNLPDGNILFSTQYDKQYFVYTPGHAPIPEGKPTVAAVSKNDCEFMITGNLFNGISEGSAYGDDWQMSTNYPIVRLKTANGRIFYARTHDWNHTGIQIGLPDTAYFSLPATVPNGNYSLSLSANGISSDPFSFDYVNCTTGIATTEKTEMQLKAYPNPAHEKVSLFFDAEEGKSYTLRMTDVYGRLVWAQENKAVAGVNNYLLDLSLFAKGMYAASIEQGGQLQTVKIVVE